MSRLLAFLRSPQVRRPIFIIGCGRSGTTLLFQLLRRNPAVIPTTGYPDGEDHEGWNVHGCCRIAGLGYTKDGGHTGYHYCLHLEEADATPEAVAGMHRYYWLDILGGKASKRVLNKCPHLSNKLGYVRAIFPDALFVHIVRDCLPVVASWVKVMETQPYQVLYWPDTPFPCFWVLPAPGDADPARVFRNEPRVFPGGGIDMLAEYWAVTNANIRKLSESFASQVMTVRFEDLCADPLRTLNAIASFCDLPRFDGEQRDDYGRVVEGERNAKYLDVLSDSEAARCLERSREVRSQFGYAGDLALGVPRVSV